MSYLAQQGRWAFTTARVSRVYGYRSGISMQPDYSFWLGLWGSVIATALAGIKLWEFYRDSRLGLTTSYSFTSLPEYGNEIIIENTSKTPALITYWELIWARRILWFNIFELGGEYPDEGYCDITIPAHARHMMPFREENHFKTKREIDGHRVALYLKLYLAGKSRPVWLRVWKSNS